MMIILFLLQLIHIEFQAINVNIINSMLVIQNIKIKFQKNITPVKIKTISVGYNQSYSSNQKKYQQVSTHVFQWHENITLPLYYNVPLQFTCKTDENYDNPQDPNTQLSSKIKIIDYKQVTFEGNLMNKNNQIVATVHITFKILNQRLIIPEDKGRLVISSILAHFDNHYGNKGLMEISVGYKSLFTPTVNVIAGQLLWGQQMSLPIEESNPTKGSKDEINMKIIVDQKIIGLVKITLESIKNLKVKYKKFKIFDANDASKSVGILFLDISFQDRLSKQQQKPTQLPNQYSLSLKKVSQFQNKKPSSQKNLNNVNIFAYKHDENEQSSSRSERMLPSLISGSNSKPDLLKIESKIQKRKRRIKNPDLFQGVFNLGDIQKTENIRQIFRERRQKKGTNASLPKLK